MNKGEIITLSSDEENDSVHQPQHKKLCTVITKKKMTQNIIENREENKVIKSENGQIKKTCTYKETRNKNGIKRKKCISDIKSPEVVDLEESSEKLPAIEFVIPKEEKLNHSNGNVNNVFAKDEPHISEKNQDNTEKICNVENKKSSAFTDENDTLQQNIVISKLMNSISKEIKEKQSDGCPQFFDEFVYLCGSFESIPNDRERLIKKLKKRFGEADPKYVQSQDFKNIIEKSNLKLNKNNLYLIAKEVTDVLSLKKKLEVTTDNSVEKSQRHSEIKIDVSKDCTPQNRKRMKMLRKITRKLDRLGLKIKELEETEVDLSDEEESVYVKLQRFRDRYCQIYKKLCEYNNEASDAGRVFCRKICFTGSKYPAINRCIENWLNKTKRFPDFSDVMKLLESQATTLNLPSNKDSLRVIATEIFQQVGVMLQRRRKYDLWDSFCGFLDDQRDPAENDSELEKVLKQNFDARVKKEEEIFNYYVEKQEKEKLQPEEVPDEEANLSPVESGSEDEKEIEQIEKRINERMNEEEMENGFKVNGAGDVLKNKLNGAGDPNYPPGLNHVKETKNNYKNCKSVKWKKEKRLPLKEENNMEDSASDSEKNKNFVPAKDKETKYESDLDLIGEEPLSVIKKITPKTLPLSPNSKMKILSQKIPKSLSITLKKNLTPKVYPEKMKNPPEDKLEILEIDTDDESSEYKKEVFQVEYCQIQQNFSVDKLDFLFEDRGRRKKLGQERVFRDLTNIGRLMELNDLKRKPLLLFSRFLHYRCFRKLGKPAWKRRSVVSNKSTSQKCALNYEKSSDKNVDGGSGDTEEKNTQNNSESGGDEGSSFSGGNRSGSEEDNNENDENKKNKGSGDGDKKETEDEEKEEEHEEEEEKGEDNSQNSVENSKNENRLTENVEEPVQNFEVQETELEKEVEETKPQNEVSKVENDDAKIELENQDIKKEIESEDSKKEVESEDSKKEVENEDSKKEIENEDSKKETENEDSKKEIENKDSKKEIEIEDTKIKIENESTKRKTENEDIKIEIKNEKTKKEMENKDTKKEIQKEKTEKEVENKVKKIQDLKAEPEKEDTKTKVKVDSKNSNEEEIKKKSSVKEKSLKEAVVQNKSEITTRRRSQAKEPAPPIKTCVTRSSARNAIEKINSGEVNGKRETRLTENTPKVEKSNQRKVEPQRETNSTEFIRVKKMANNRTDFQPKEATPQPKNSIASPPVTSPRIIDVESMVRNIRKRNNPNISTSDEERVKKFLLHSPSSISITPPRKMSVSKPPSQAALQALATLRGLKGISATRVRVPAKSEDDVVVIGESSKRQPEQNVVAQVKRRRSDLPVISNVQSIKPPTPKIVTVQGNATGFGNTNRFVRQNNGQNNSDSSSIRISNVWGGLTDSFYQSMQNSEVAPGCSFRQNVPSASNVAKKKNAKKTVEYVVLE